MAPVAAPAPQVAAIDPVPSAAPRRRDYGWLSETISRRVEELKRYPAEARLDRAEGRVVIKAVLRADGSVDDVEIFQSSGYRTLDQAALELIQRAAPFQLPHPLGRSKMTVKIPMSYRLEP
jgi:protein TonB